MATQIYLGMPPPKIKEWIEKNYNKPEEPVDMTKVPLHFTANEPGSSVSLVCWDDNEYKFADSWCEFQYSTDGMKSWKDYPKAANSEDAEIKLDDCENNTVYFKAKQGNVEGNPNLSGLSQCTVDEGMYFFDCIFHKFVMKGSIKADGNIQFLLENTGTKMEAPDYCYADLFHDCSSLTQAPLLPATTLEYGCYQRMFQYCSSLTKAPELPAATLAEECYYYMFSDCTSLTNAYFPNLDSDTVINEVVGNQLAFSNAADNIKTQCSNGIIIINPSEA